MEEEPAAPKEQPLVSSPEAANNNVAAEVGIAVETETDGDDPPMLPASIKREYCFCMHIMRTQQCICTTPRGALWEKII